MNDDAEYLLHCEELAFEGEHKRMVLAWCL